MTEVDHLPKALPSPSACDVTAGVAEPVNAASR